MKAQLLAQPQHGVFLDSCHHHCGNWDGSEIDGMLSGAALQEWCVNIARLGGFKMAPTIVI